MSRGREVNARAALKNAVDLKSDTNSLLVLGFETSFVCARVRVYFVIQYVI